MRITFPSKHILSSKLFLTVSILLISIVLAGVLYVRYLRPSATDLEEEVVEAVIEFDEYGIEHGLYDVHSGVVGNRQTLSHILSGLGVSAVQIDEIARNMREVFDPRRIRSGQAFHGYFGQDSTSLLRYFVYEISHLEFLKMDFSEGGDMARMEKDVVAVQGMATGVIRSSLWNALSGQGLNTELAIKLSEILAWEVDFYRIQQGDKFKVIYEENYIGDKSVGIARIDAIYFMHQGREIHGFRFEQDTIDGFFNGDGENLRKVFLKAPLEFGRITSRYSHSRLHPILKHRRPHYGTDYAAPHGTPILSVGDGVVTQSAYNSGNGNYVRIRHNSVYETQYLHMSRFASGIRPGTRVKQGQVIGYVGSTGLATGPHVCFRFWKNGQQVDHLREEFPSADNLPEAYLATFREIRDRHLSTMSMMYIDGEDPA
jgi:murein DD-endopeptidase MepM/ murein hydrolase activator NlpD